MNKIIGKEKLNDSVILMEISAAAVAEKAEPGQFIILRVDEKGERIPLTIAGYDRDRGTVTVIFQIVGATTQKLNAKQLDDYIADIAGPLGKPTDLSGVKSAAVIGGGVGCAIAYPVAKKLRENGASVDTVIGFRNRQAVILESEFSCISNNLYVMTDDGSYGEKGLVTEMLKKLLDGVEKYDEVIAIGPLPMMKYVSLLTKEYAVKTTVSMNPIMIDGTGMCGCCRLTVGGETKFACVDGPDFDGHAVDFDEALSRLNIYDELGAKCGDSCNLFSEVARGLSPEEAVTEAAKCLNCKSKPCAAGCPVGVDIPAFIGKIKQGDFPGAYDIISKDNLLPAICGRVCPQEKQCEESCVLVKKGESVSVGALERFAADFYSPKVRENYIKPVKNGYKAAIVGSGPAGLTCAGELARLGYSVTVFEALHRAGGVLVYGIPEFRLPKSIVEREINGLKKLGVLFWTNSVIGKTFSLDDLFTMGFDAVFVGSGAGLPRFMGIPGENFKGVYSANEFLTRVNLMKAYDKDFDTPVYNAKSTAVIGGGNVAMDAARCAKRLGSENVYIVYRRGEDEMPARRDEIVHARNEGIIFKTLCLPIEIAGDKSNHVNVLKCAATELGEPDKSGRRSPVIIPDSEFSLEVDSVIVAVGTSPNPLIKNNALDIKTDKRGCFITDENGMTTRPGVFAGGDIVTGAATVILAMGAGKKAAAAMDRYVRSV